MGGAAAWIAGVDLAWGERRADGACAIEWRAGRARVAGYGYTHGDEALLAWLGAHVPRRGAALVAIDGPIVCPNPTGARPVDRLTHARFHREHAGCHPANATKCPRPARVAARLAEQGYAIGHAWRPGARLATEVYPHPAIVRLLRLPRIVKYKRGRVGERRREFARLQRGLADAAARELPALALGEETRELLAAPWSKPVEDRVDALVCALVGLWHVVHGGRRSEVLGDLATGFIVLPEELRAPHERPGRLAGRRPQERARAAAASRSSAAAARPVPSASGTA